MYLYTNIAKTTAFAIDKTWCTMHCMNNNIYDKSRNMAKYQIKLRVERTNNKGNSKISVLVIFKNHSKTALSGQVFAIFQQNQKLSVIIPFYGT